MYTCIPMYTCIYGLIFMKAILKSDINRYVCMYTCIPMYTCIYGLIFMKAILKSDSVVNRRIRNVSQQQICLSYAYTLQAYGAVCRRFVSYQVHRRYYCHLHVSFTRRLPSFRRAPKTSYCPQNKCCRAANDISGPTGLSCRADNDIGL